MKTPLNAAEVSRYYGERIPAMAQRGPEWRTCCPIHDGENDNFAVNAETGQFYCHSRCQRGGSVVDLEMQLSGADFKTAVAEVERIVGRVPNAPTRKRIVATYDYVDERGTLLYQAVRYEPKQFKQRRPNGRGGWIWNLEGVTRVPYQLLKVIAAETVFIVEGEKDVHALQNLGFTATCNSEGAGKWRKDFARYFDGKSVAVFPDNDEPGRRHADQVIATLTGVAAAVRRVPVPIGKDVSDWITAGATAADIEAAIATSEPLDESTIAADSAAAGGASDVGRTLPEIIVTSRQLRDLTHECLVALQQGNEPPLLFVRDGALVELRRNELGRHFIHDLTDVHVRGLLARAASFFRYNKRGDLVSCSPPNDAAKDILALAALGQWFLRIEGITEIPVIRPDGTILTAAGYDVATGLYHAPDPKLVVPAIAERPTTEEISAALAVIEDAIGDFPFVEDLIPPTRDMREARWALSASKANALALMLTPVVRPVISGSTPLALIDAPNPGTGKTLLAEVVSIIATGRDAALFSAPGNEEEWRKQITAYLREGAGVIVIDNVTHELDSGQLCKALTAGTWADRILGHTQTVRIPVRCTWIATGNNISVRGDLPRRCYTIRLDAGMDSPHLRAGFRHPKLRQWVQENRGSLLAALLTLSRAWFADGQPPGPNVIFGSYERWSEVISGILHHAAVHGFLENRVDDEPPPRDGDGSTAEYVRFTEQVYRAIGDSRFTAADIHGICLNEATGRELARALPNGLALDLNNADRFRRRLGKRMSELARLPDSRSGLRIRADGQIRGSQVWRIVGMFDEP